MRKYKSAACPDSDFQVSIRQMVRHPFLTGDICEEVPSNTIHALLRSKSILHMRRVVGR
jgi:hypothetical protein